jgi:hypothetical protein
MADPSGLKFTSMPVLGGKVDGLLYLPPNPLSASHEYAVTNGEELWLTAIALAPPPAPPEADISFLAAELMTEPAPP